MITLTQAQIDILQGAAPGFVAVLMEFELDAGTQRFSSLPFDWTDPEANTWLGANGVLSLGETFERMGLEGGAMSLVWAAADATLLAAANDAAILNAPFTRSVVTIDDNGTRVGSAMIDFVGECELPDLVPDPENPTITLTIENEIIKLRRNHSYRYSATNHQRFFAGDTFFDEVGTLQDKDIFDDAGGQSSTAWPSLPGRRDMSR